MTLLFSQKILLSYRKGMNKMSYFKRTFLLSDKEKIQVSEMCGKIILYALEGRSIGYMSKMLNLSPYEIKNNINEMLYVLLKQVGKREYLKTMFMK